MSVLLPPSSRSGAAVRAVIQKRKFRIILECLECERAHPLNMTLYDEPDDAATKHDFYESGVIDRIRFRCEACGCEQASYTEVMFVEDPADVRKYGGEIG